MATENSAAIRELFTRLRDLDVRAKRAGDAAGFLDQMLRLAGGGFPSGSACGPGFVSAFPSVFSCIPESMPFMIVQDTGGSPPVPYPFGTLAWDGSSDSDAAGKWAGCVQFSRPAHTGCTARSIPLFAEVYKAGASNELGTRIKWIAAATCPDTGKTCSDGASTSRVLTFVPVSAINYGDASGTIIDGHFGYASNSATDQDDTSPTFHIDKGARIGIWANYNYYTPDFRVWLPQSPTLVDSMYGTTTLSWDGEGWAGCISGISYPGYSTCAARTIAIHYKLYGPIAGGTDNIMEITWTVTGSVCPTTSTCATVTNAFAQDNFGDITWSSADSTASPINLVWKYTAGTTGSIQKLYRNTSASITIKVP